MEIYCADIENDRMILSTMLKSPYSVGFRLLLEDWIQSLKELGKSNIMEKIFKLCS